MNKLDKIRRIICTGIAFLTFGLTGPILTFIFIPLIGLMYRDPKLKARKVKYLVHKCFALFVWWMKTLGVCNFEYKNLERVKEDGGALVLANHPCLIDVVVLISIYPRANCVVKKALWENPLTRGVVSSAGYIPSDGATNVLEACDAALKDGDTLIVFPEGTRTVPNEKVVIKRGASQVALRLGCPIRLVKISMNPTTLTKAERWYQVPHKKPVFSIEIADRVYPETYTGYTKTIHSAAKALTQDITNHLWGDAHGAT